LEVLCLNDPVRGEDVGVRTCMGEAIGIDLVAYDADILADGFQEHPLTFEAIHGPEQGTLSADWTNVMYWAGRATLRVVYTPDPNFVGEDVFLVRVSDLFGDTSYIRVRVEVDACGRRPVGAAGEVLFGPVVIHEVAWAGTAASAEDQWIELMNVSSEPVDLTGWILRWRKKEPKTETDLVWREIRLQGVIPAQGLFLLERGHDEVVRDLPADLVYPTTMRVGHQVIPLLFSREGDVLELLDAQGRVVDTANADPRWRGWAAGDLRTKATMERRSPLLPDLAEHWWTNLGLVTHGQDRENQELLGTARALNEPEVLLLQGDALEVEAGEKVVLTRLMPVGPGATVRAALLRSDANGNLFKVESGRLELRWDEARGLLTVLLNTAGLEAATYHLVVVLDGNRYLVARLRVR
ncbi:MAG: lamin tail domain-containing protein, partial [Candidatus Bipolaricaulota bacterium]|nr:lamin tail domain-containing protein [Candidatus Bipolaricaulota bacterium]